MAGRLSMGIQELEGELRTETGSVSINIRLVEPTRDDRHLAQLVELQLERQRWTGGIMAIRWTALKLGRSVASPGHLVSRRSLDESFTSIQQSGRAAQQPP